MGPNPKSKEQTLRAEEHRRKWLEELQWHHTRVRKWVLPVHLLNKQIQACGDKHIL